jgi:hypothetical protein
VRRQPGRLPDLMHLGRRQNGEVEVDGETDGPASEPPLR